MITTSCVDINSACEWRTMAKVGLLNGKGMRLTSGDIVIAPKWRRCGLAGVMGGMALKFRASRKNIVANVPVRYGHAPRAQLCATEFSQMR